MALISDGRQAPTGLTTGYGRVSTDTTSGTMYAFVSQNSSESAATIKAGGQSVTVTSSPVSFDFTDLPTGPTLYNHFVQNDGSDSNVVSTSGYTCVNDRPEPSGPTFERVKKVAINNTRSNANTWDCVRYGDYVYFAGDSDGVYVWDFSNPANPTQLATVAFIADTECTDVIVIGDHLFACGRKIDFTVSNTAGWVASYDLSSPAAPVQLDTFQGPDFQVAVPNGFSNNWPQGMSTDGTWLFVACQRYGLTVIDISDPSDLTQHTEYTSTDYQADESEPGFLFEASRCTTIGGWTYLATHGDGIIGIHTSSLGTSGSPIKPTNPQPLGQYRAAGLYGAQDVNLRARNVVSETIKGRHYLFESGNIGASVDRVERGLVIRDVTDPENASTIGYAYIGCADNDLWLGAGDQPHMGLMKFGQYVYVATGQRGTAVFDVTDLFNPVYLGLQGTDMEPGTNLYQTFIFEKDGTIWACYADGVEPSGQENHYLYIDEANTAVALSSEKCSPLVSGK